MKLCAPVRPPSKPRGGVASVELLPAREFVAAVYDAPNDCFTSLETSIPFTPFPFREDRAAYREEVSSEGGSVSVLHTLTIELPAVDETRRAAERLAQMSSAGFVAVVTLPTGERLLAGYSPRFGSRFPLRVARLSADRGKSPSDFPTETLVLTSLDCERSKPLKEG